MSGVNMKRDSAMQSVTNHLGDKDFVESEDDKTNDEIILNQITIKSIKLVKNGETFTEDESSKSVKLIATDADVEITHRDKPFTKVSLTNKSVHFNDKQSSDEIVSKKDFLRPILKAVTFEEGDGIDNVAMSNVVDSLDNESSEDSETDDLHSDISEASEDIDEEIEHEAEPLNERNSNKEFNHYVEKLRSTGKIEKVAFIDSNGGILSQSVGMHVRAEDAEGIMCVLRSPSTSLVKIRIGKQDYTCFKTNAISFVGRSENDFLHVCSCLNFIVICISDPSSPGSCIYEVSRFVKRCNRTSIASMNEFESAVV